LSHLAFTPLSLTLSPERGEGTEIFCLRGHRQGLSRETFQAFARQLVRGICLATYVTDDAPTPAAPLANFVNGHPEAVARWHSTTDDWSAIRAHDHTMMRPAGGGKIERARAHVRFQLSRPTRVRKTERFRIDRPPPNKNGQATSGPAMLIQRGVYINHQALPQRLFPPVWRYFLTGSQRRRRGAPARISEEPSMM
jgi:hypothetical protein